MPGFVGQQIRAEFFVIALLQNLRFEIPSLREALNVISIPFKISFQLRESQIMRIQSKESEASPCVRKHCLQTVRVVFRRCHNCDRIQKQFVFAVKGGAFARNLGEGVPQTWHNGQVIYIAGGSGNTVDLCHYEAATTMQLNVLVEQAINISEKRSPRLRQFLSVWHTATDRP